jgi:hypothetical protein
MSRSKEFCPRASPWEKNVSLKEHCGQNSLDRPSRTENKAILRGANYLTDNVLLKIDLEITSTQHRRFPKKLSK